MVGNDLDDGHFSCYSDHENEGLCRSLGLPMPGRVSAEQHSGEREMAAGGAGSSAEGSLCCPLLSDDIKACQGCEGTDCEFPVFNVFHPELSLYSDLAFI